MTPNLLDLKRRTQENLIAFLTTEVDLASTFCEMAESIQDPAHRAKLLEDAQKAVSAVRHFGERITDRTTRADLHHEADRLDEFLARISDCDRQILETFGHGDDIKEWSNGTRLSRARFQRGRIS